MTPAVLLGDQARGWRWLALLGGATLAGLLAMRFEIRWASLAAPLAGAAILHGVSLFYRRIRRDDRLAAACEALAQLIAFTMIAGPFSYLAASVGGPLQDQHLAALDTAMGLDWRAWLALLNAEPGVARLLSIPYRTLLPQLAIVVLILGFSGRLRALRTIVWAAALSGTLSILLSALFPAIGAYAHYALSPADFPHIQPAAPYLHVADYTGLRAGSLRTIDLLSLQGIITFPSFHAALAAIYGWAFWQHPAARWPGLALEALVIVSTPVDGGHYFVDVAGGLLVALLSIQAARRIVAGRAAPASAPGSLRPGPVQSIAIPPLT